jgi:glycosidase
MDGTRSQLDLMLKECADIPKNCAWAAFLRNHDELSLATLSDAERTALVDYLDPEHCYIFRGGPYGDYTTSMRLGSMFEKNPEKILEAFRLLYSIPGAQVMYYGDEIGMTNLPVQEGVVDTRMYVRGEFDWLEARGQIQDPDSLFTKTKDIILQSYWPWEIYNPGS